MVTASTTLYVIRHAQSEGNVSFERGIILPPVNELGTVLTKHGHLQAQRLVEHFRETKIDAIYTSHLLRAWQTARSLVAGRNLEVCVRPDLRERVKTQEQDPEAQQRITTALKDIVSLHPSQTIAVVSHGFVISAFLIQIGFATAQDLPQGSIENTGYVHFAIQNGIFQVIKTVGVQRRTTT